MNTLIPLWIIGGPVIGLLILAFSFRGPSSMGGTGTRLPPRGYVESVETAAPILDPVHPSATRRLV